MRLEITLGHKTVVVEDYSREKDEEASLSWPTVLDDIIWPALRGYGYFLDSDFTNSIPEQFDQYLEDMRNANHSMGRVGTSEEGSEVQD